MQGFWSPKFPAQEDGASSQRLFPAALGVGLFGSSSKLFSSPGRLLAHHPYPTSEYSPTPEYPHKIPGAQPQTSPKIPRVSLECPTPECTRVLVTTLSLSACWPASKLSPASSAPPSLTELLNRQLLLTSSHSSLSPLALHPTEGLNR